MISSIYLWIRSNYFNLIVLNCWLWFNFRFEACSRCNYTTPLQINRHFLLKCAAITLKLFSFDASSWVKNASYTWYLPRIRIFVSFLTQWLLSVISQFYKINENCENTLCNDKNRINFSIQNSWSWPPFACKCNVRSKVALSKCFGGLLKFNGSLCLV